MWNIRKGQGCIVKMHIATDKDIRDAEGISAMLYIGDNKREYTPLFDEITKVVYIPLSAEDISILGEYSISVAVRFTATESIYTPIYPFAIVSEDAEPMSEPIEVEIFVDGEDITVVPPAINPEGSQVSVLFPITHSELVALRDAGQLTAGAFYRITDYETVTTQANTTSAGYQFDIIVQALDERTLSEDAQAIHHEGDTYFANSRLESWQLKYTLDNDTARFSWAKEGVKGRDAKWSCGGGVIETRKDSEAISVGETVIVDGNTRYLYRPDNLTSYLNGKEFYRTILGETITSTEDFRYEADYPLIYNEEDEYYEEYPSEVRVKTADGQLVAVLINNGENEFYDEGDYDGNMEYPISFTANEYDEEDGIYLLKPSSGIEDWWTGFVGGSFEKYEKDVYTGPTDALYYIFDSPLPNSNVYAWEVYSKADGKVYIYGEDIDNQEYIDYITYTSYVAPVAGGKGVIYRMIDEHGNDLPYDFKNIQHFYNNGWYFTFDWNGTEYSNRQSFKSSVYDNKFVGGRKIPTIINRISNNSPVPTPWISNNNIGVTIESAWFNTGDMNGCTWFGGSKGSDQEAYIGTFTNEGNFANCLFFGGVLSLTHSNGQCFDSTFLFPCITGGNKNTLNLNHISSHYANVCVDMRACNYNEALTIEVGYMRNCAVKGFGKLESGAHYDDSTFVLSSDVKLNYTGTTTTSLKKPLSNIVLDANNWTAAETIDLAISPMQSYVWHIGKNRSGATKQWCDADLAQ